MVYVTENGWRDKGVIEDNDRVEYLHDHLQEILHVIENKQSDIRGYTGKRVVLIFFFLLSLFKS